MDRSSDPSPFAWIFGAAVALVAVGGVVTALRRERIRTPETAAPHRPVDLPELADTDLDVPRR